MANPTIERLTDALDENSSAKEDLVALGTIVTCVIFTVAKEERANLVESFCKTLRKSVASDMN